MKRHIALSKEQITTARKEDVKRVLDEIHVSREEIINKRLKKVRKPLKFNYRIYEKRHLKNPKIKKVYDKERAVTSKMAAKRKAIHDFEKDKNKIFYSEKAIYQKYIKHGKKTAVDLDDFASELGIKVKKARKSNL